MSEEISGGGKPSQAQSHTQMSTEDLLKYCAPQNYTYTIIGTIFLTGIVVGMIGYVLHLYTMDQITNTLEGNIVGLESRIISEYRTSKNTSANYSEQVDDLTAQKTKTETDLNQSKKDLQKITDDLNACQQQVQDLKTSALVPVAASSTPTAFQ